MKTVVDLGQRWTRRRGPAFTGDVTFCNATVIDKLVDEQSRPVVQVDFKMTNQLGTTLATAKAELQLPRR